MHPSRKILIAVPEVLLKQADTIAQERGMTRSDFVREAMRSYLDHKANELAERELKHAKAQEIMASLKAEHIANENRRNEL